MSSMGAMSRAERGARGGDRLRVERPAAQGRLCGRGARTHVGRDAAEREADVRHDAVARSSSAPAKQTLEIACARRVPTLR